MTESTPYVEVRGSEGDVYRVSFLRGDGGVKVQCTCRAGRKAKELRAQNLKVNLSVR